MNPGTTIGVLGATSPVGARLIAELAEKGFSVLAFTRQPIEQSDGPVRWVQLSAFDAKAARQDIGSIQTWIAASPIWIIHEHFAMLEALGAERVVCLSSTSRYTKVSSSSSYEEQTVRRLEEGEGALEAWGAKSGVQWTILRPTLIYGRGNDRNLSEIVKLIRKLKFFPVFGPANGLRQPIYVDDVATACILAAFSPEAANKAYNISGAERLSYKEMVARVFKAMGLKPRMLTIHLGLFNAALYVLKRIPRYRNWNADMVQRMNRDMVFDHAEATRDFAFDPRPFVLQDRDVT